MYDQKSPYARVRQHVPDEVEERVEPPGGLPAARRRVGERASASRATATRGRGGRRSCVRARRRCRGGPPAAREGRGRHRAPRPARRRRAARSGSPTPARRARSSSCRRSGRRSSGAAGPRLRRTPRRAPRRRAGPPEQAADRLAPPAIGVGDRASGPAWSRPQVERRGTGPSRRPSASTWARSRSSTYRSSAQFGHVGEPLPTAARPRGNPGRIGRPHATQLARGRTSSTAFLGCPCTRSSSMGPWCWCPWPPRAGG